MSYFDLDVAPSEPCLPTDLPTNTGSMSALARDYEGGMYVMPHSHPWGQLIYAVSGVMRVATPQGNWILPPNRALWVPAGTRHALRMTGDVAMRNLFIEPGTGSLPQTDCKVVTVSGLLRELILAAIAANQDSPDKARLAHIHALILDEFRLLDAQPLRLTMPKEPRLRRICMALLDNPGCNDTLDQWAEWVGASSRTLARLFQQELGMRFQDWRQHARLGEALTRLAGGTPIGTLSFELGYASQAAFTAMFRRTLGCAPRDYLPNPDRA